MNKYYNIESAMHLLSIVEENLSTVYNLLSFDQKLSDDTESIINSVISFREDALSIWNEMDVPGDPHDFGQYCECEDCVSND